MAGFPRSRVSIATQSPTTGELRRRTGLVAEAPGGAGAHLAVRRQHVPLAAVLHADPPRLEPFRTEGCEGCVPACVPAER